MKIGIIGLGWLGLPLAKSLLNKGFHVTGSTRSRTVELAHERFLHVLFDPALKKTADFSSFKDVDILILAFTPSRTDLRAYARDCVRILDLIAPSCKVIQISSTSIYPQRSGVYTESDFPAGTFKSNTIGDGELMLSSMLRERVTIIRMAGLIGPGRYPVTAMSKSGKTYQADERINVIHLEDAIGLIEFVIEYKLWNKTINACASEHPLKGDFYTRMASRLKIDPPAFERQTSSERIISNSYSMQLGYRYIYPDPDEFPVA